MHDRTDISVHTEVERNGLINIQGLDKAEVLALLYNNTKTVGMRLFDQSAHNDQSGLTMTIERAKKEIIENPRLRFNYLYGKAIQVDLSKDSFDPTLYDRDNGPGLAKVLIASLRKNTEKPQIDVTYTESTLQRKSGI